MTSPRTHWSNRLAKPVPGNENNSHRRDNANVSVSQQPRLLKLGKDAICAVASWPCDGNHTRRPQAFLPQVCQPCPRPLLIISHHQNHDALSHEKRKQHDTDVTVVLLESAFPASCTDFCFIKPRPLPGVGGPAADIATRVRLRWASSTRHSSAYLLFRGKVVPGAIASVTGLSEEQLLLSSRHYTPTTCLGKHVHLHHCTTAW